MDLVDVRGIRENQLVGYGLVVGLAGQGDRNQVKFTSQSITNMLRQFGVQIDDSMDPKLRNVASVSVTASVDPMAGPGQTLDVVVSSIGDAKVCVAVRCFLRRYAVSMVKCTPSRKVALLWAVYLLKVKVVRKSK